jgi:hypothetical protein
VATNPSALIPIRDLISMAVLLSSGYLPLLAGSGHPGRRSRPRVLDIAVPGWAARRLHVRIARRSTYHSFGNDKSVEIRAANDWI